MYPAGSIRISVNDASEAAAVFGFDDCFTSSVEPLRSVRSLSRLDIMVKREEFSSSAVASSDDEFDGRTDDGGLRADGVLLAKRCESFPRIDRESLSAYRAHLLDTDSMSPRLSSSSLSQYLDNELPTLAVDRLDLTTGDVPISSRQITPLTRSVSARLRVAVDGCVQTNDRSIGGAASLLADYDDSPSRYCTCRSTSCPSITCPPHINRASPTPALGNFQLFFTQPHNSSRAAAAVTVNHQDRFDDEPATSAAMPPKLQRRDLFTVNRDDDQQNEAATTGRVDLFSDRLMLAGYRNFDIDQSASMSSRYQVDDVIFSGVTASPRSVSIHRKNRQRTPHMADFKCMRWLQSLDSTGTDH